MTSAKALLERAAMCVEGSAIGQHKEDVIKLIALHIIRLCGPADVGEETRLLLAMLDEKR